MTLCPSECELQLLSYSTEIVIICTVTIAQISQNGLSTMMRILTLSRLRLTLIAWSLKIRATSAGSPLWAISSCLANAMAS